MAASRPPPMLYAPLRGGLCILAGRCGSDEVNFLVLEREPGRQGEVSAGQSQCGRPRRRGQRPVRAMAAVLVSPPPAWSVLGAHGPLLVCAVSLVGRGASLAASARVRTCLSYCVG